MTAIPALPLSSETAVNLGATLHIRLVDVPAVSEDPAATVRAVRITYHGGVREDIREDEDKTAFQNLVWQLGDGYKTVAGQRAGITTPRGGKPTLVK